MKIVDKFKEKQLIKKFDKASELVQDSQKGDSLTNQGLDYQIISWRSHFEKDSYKSWVFNNFYTDLQLFFTSESITLDSYKFVKDSNNRKKLIVNIKESNIDTVKTFFAKLKLQTFDMCSEVPFIKKVKKSKNLYSIAFLINEEEIDYEIRTEQTTESKQNQSLDRSGALNK